jgi:hypothetical protein
VAEVLFTVVLMLAAFVVMFVVDAHGKARAFENGRTGSARSRPPEAVTSVDLPPPHFNQRDNRRES